MAFDDNLKKDKLNIHPQYFLTAIVAIIMLSAIADIIVVRDSLMVIRREPEVISAMPVSDNVYRFNFPFISNRGDWETSLNHFIKLHPDKKIQQIYTAPDQFKSKADNAVIYLITE